MGEKESCYSRRLLVTKVGLGFVSVFIYIFCDYYYYYFCDYCFKN